MTIVNNRDRDKQTQKDFGYLNIDDNIELKCYYNLSTNEIYNANGSIADYQMTYETNTKLSINELNIFKKITAKNSLPSLNNILVDDGIIFASNFDQSVYLKTTTEAPGIYLYKSDALVKSPDSIDALKKDKLYFEENYLKEFKPTIELKIDTQAFIYYLNILKDFGGKDDLRPIMTGVLLEIDFDNNIYLVATNAVVLARFNVSEYCSVISKEKTTAEIVLNLNLLVDFLKISDEFTTLKTNQNILILESINSKFVSKNVDGNYPNYKSILPTEFTKKIVLNAKEIIECFKTTEVKNFIKENKQKNKDGIFNLIATEDNLEAIILKFKVETKTRIPQSSSYKLETAAEIELCHTKINLEDFKESKIIDSLLLIMPIMAEEEKLLFAFNVSLFEQLISNYNNDKATMYSVSPTRAFLIDAAPLDFNKTVNYKRGLYVIESPGFNVKKTRNNKKAEIEKGLKSIDIQEAIEALELTLEFTEKNSDQKEIQEAIEALKTTLEFV
jgi:DNA polymerase III sliding clamp (beta) subunit (PCNA family)